ncbi:hypothetical protein [Mesorhizobium sp. WSM3860]|uniref:hypothetical protein n=1 Tax=Mesorhizobium sp. WSM3860 TaxID=2029403 RepID=UPI000BAFC242|nr:hypothetical protein [Mesorhizobium sp. WSM3860]PBC00789.1 hypothetical protein CK220_29470 [Mesorhizobium sp. WSM3860]
MTGDPADPARRASAARGTIERAITADIARLGASDEALISPQGGEIAGRPKGRAKDRDLPQS